MYCREESSGDNGCKNKYGVEESYSSENTYHIVYVTSLFRKMMVLPHEAENILLNSLIDASIMLQRWQRGEKNHK